MALKEIKKEDITNIKGDLNRIFFYLENGDLKVLDEIKEKWNFKDRESVIRFALAVMSQAKGQALFVMDEKNEKKGLKPSDNLLNIKQEIQEIESKEEDQGTEESKKSESPN